MIPTKWRVLETDPKIVQGLSQMLDLPEPVAKILVSRGMSDGETAQRFLRKSMNDLESPFELNGMDLAADRIATAIEKREPLIVHGDFDADGITSAAVLSLFLRDQGGVVIPFVPNRLVEGHGVSLRALKIAKEAGAKLLITCDCGSSSANEIKELYEAGIETIVTDHHEPPEKLPQHSILVNPKIADRRFQDELSGVGVAFMVAVATRARLRDRGYYLLRDEPNLKSYLDIVAVGTLADLAPITDQNRILVSYGLEELSKFARPGIVAMCQNAGIEGPTLGVTDVGFKIAPRINAAARLGHADIALKLLMASQADEAENLAGQLEKWNSERQALQAQMTRQVTPQAEEQISQGKKSILCASETFHPGLVGLVAQNLSKTYGLPSMIFVKDGSIYRGSARSPAGFNVVKALESVADLLIQFGGHASAGGCSLQASDFSEFKRRFEASAAIQEDGSVKEFFIDAELGLGQVSAGIVSALDRLKPYGMGNPEPIFVSKAMVRGTPREMGKDHVRVTLQGESGPPVQAVGFSMFRSVSPKLQGSVEVAYNVDRNEWKGGKNLQIKIAAVRTM